ncbi:MAG: hypothetical protein FWG46_07965 [Treponema sp.]|nr:hypothetical protein [Treponema sp.]
MNIGTVPYHTFPSIGHAISISQNGGRMSLPVSPSSYIYSQFKHVSGVPAPDGVKGVNISKLAIIDSLVDQISRMKKDVEPVSGIEDQDWDKRLNMIIDKYQSQLRNIQTASAGNPYAPASPLLGALFSISV